MFSNGKNGWRQNKTTPRSSVKEKTQPLTFRGIYPKAVEKWELWNVQRIHGMGLYTQNGGKVETVGIPARGKISNAQSFG